MASNKIFILWADSDANNNDENIETQEKLSNEFDNVKIYEDEQICRQFIKKNSKNNLFLIVSGRLSRQIVPVISHYDHVLAIYIYCRDWSLHTEWAKGFSKIQNIITDLDDLISAIKSDLKSFEKQPIGEDDIQPIHVSSVINGKTSCHLDGYQNVSLSSIEEATSNLHDLIEGLDQMVWIAKQSTQNPADGLTSDESASINLYTMPWYSKEESFAFILNKTLRKENRQQIKPWFPYLRLFFQACSKLKTVSSIVYYGTTNDVTSKYSEGKISVVWEFMNCTDMIQVLENDDEFGRKGKRTLITIECQTGKDIRKHAHGQCPYHILLLPGRQFQVLNCDRLDDDLTSIQLTELNALHAFK